MLQAIAESAGNKARGTNDNGHVILVQGRFAAEPGHWWYHLWRIERDVVEDEEDVRASEFLRVLRERFFIDPLATYWSPV